MEQEDYKRRNSKEVGDEIISLVEKDLVANLERTGVDLGMYLGSVLNAYTLMQQMKFEKGRDLVFSVATIGLNEAKKYLEDRLGKKVDFRNTKRAGYLMPQLIGSTDDGFWSELSRIDNYATEIAKTQSTLNNFDINYELMTTITDSIRCRPDTI